MEKLFVQKLGKVKKHKKDIEKALKVNIKFAADGAEIESKDENAYNEYIARHVIEALEMGFSFESAIKLKNEDYMIETISLKKHVRSSRLRMVVSRLIGEKGRTKEIIKEMTGCDVAIYDYNISIIGETEDVEFAAHAVRSLIRGAPHASVYAYLERNRKFMKYKSDEDLGLKKEFKRR